MQGNDRIDLLHRLSTNDMTKVVPGKGIQTVLLTEKARIIDVVTVLQDTDRAMIIGSPGTASSTLPWVRKYVIMDDVRLKDRTSEVEALEILGPHAAEHVHQITGTDPSAWTIGQWAHIGDAPEAPYLVRMPSPAEISFWIVGQPNEIAAMRSVLMDNAAVVPHLTDDEYAYLRIRAGLGMLGYEWGEAYNPLEAGLLHLTSFAKGCYIGQEVVARLDSYNKVKQRIMGIIADEALSPTDVVVAPDGASIGTVTSVTSTLDGKHTLALAYVRGEHAHPDTSLTVRTERGDVTVRQVLPPLEDPSCP